MLMTHQADLNRQAELIRQADIIRQADLSDIEEIMRIIKLVYREMHLEGNHQWDETYPQAVDFENDIRKKELFISEIHGRVGGFLCINHHEPEEYAQIHWSSHQTPLVLHRMAVASEFRGRGIGSVLLGFAEEFARKNGVTYLRSDTNSLNPKMNALFQKMGYSFVGQMHAFGKKVPFNFYDKVLAGSKEA